nr:hypothetical protein [Myxococcota bacterium]
DDGGGIDGGSDGGAPDGGANDGGPPPPTCGPRVLIDDAFDVAGSPGWSSYEASELQLGVEDGRLKILFPSSIAAERYAFYETATPMDLSGACVEVDVPVVPSATTEALVYAKIIVGTRDIEMTAFGGTLYARVRLGDVATIIAMQPYDPIAHRHWRIRHGPAILGWDVSSDGVAWTEFATHAEAIPVPSATVQVGAGTYRIETGAGRAEIEHTTIRLP